MTVPFAEFYRRARVSLFFAISAVNEKIFLEKFDCLFLFSFRIEKVNGNDKQKIGIKKKLVCCEIWNGKQCFSRR